MRSDAEAEIRNAVVARLRALRPMARICHEVNCSGYGPNRFDVIAVDRAEIIAVEIKSAKDKLDRAPKQIESMRRVAHHVIIAIHECHLIEKPTNKWAAHYTRDGVEYLRDAPDECKGAKVWVYPERERGPVGYSDLGRWRDPAEKLEVALPQDALDMLWRDELATLCDRLRVSRGKRATMTQMLRALRWMANGKELTLGICDALRQRQFAEADDPKQLEAAE